MKIEKLKDIEFEFFEAYPDGFENEKHMKMMKNFNPDKLELICKELFAKENFSMPEIVCENFIKMVSKSVVISFYDKLKLRDAIKAMGIYEKDMLSIALYDLLYGDKKDGFDGFVEILSEHNLAKWTLISLVPYYMNRYSEYYIKPTTTKKILSYLEIDDIKYKPKPSYEFYSEYCKKLDILKSEVKNPQKWDNMLFTAFLRNGIDICSEH